MTKVNPSSGSRKHHVFSAKRFGALLLALTCALSFTVLFAPISKTAHAFVAASTPTPLPTLSTPTPPPLNVTLTSPANGSVYTLPTSIPITFQVSTIGNSSGPFVAQFNTILQPVDYGVAYQVLNMTQQGSVDTFTATWVPQQPGTYQIVASVEFTSGPTGNQYGSSATITVQVNGTQVSWPCQVHYQLESQWPGGFNVNVVLTNTSTVTVNGWSLAFSFPGDQKITDLWNGSFAQVGQKVGVVNPIYNESISPGEAVNFGFNGTWVRNDTSPTSFVMDGMTCKTV